MTDMTRIAARINEVERKLFSMKFTNPNRKPLEDELKILKAKLRRGPIR